MADLARCVVFRWFAQPLLRRNRARGVRRGPRTCATSTRTRTPPDRAERIAAMVASSEPLVRLLGQRIGRARRRPGPLLEVLTRRYYGNRGLPA